MPPLFTTYEEAWTHFESVEDLESVGDQYPEAEAQLLTWYIPVDPADVPGVVALQETLTGLGGLLAIPPERLHVAVAPATVVDIADPAMERGLLAQAQQAWAGIEPFRIELAGVNGFPTAVVVEVHGDGPAGLLDRLLETGYWRGLPWRAPNRDIFLPHLTVAVSARRRPAADVREIVKGHRHDHFADLVVDTIELCRVPVARSRLLQPWEVVGRVQLRPSAEGKDRRGRD